MSTQNPLIDLNDHYQTLHNVSWVVSYMQEVKDSHESEPTDDVEYRLWLLQEAIRDALEHEKARALKMHWR